MLSLHSREGVAMWSELMIPKVVSKLFPMFTCNCEMSFDSFAMQQSHVMIKIPSP